MVNIDPLFNWLVDGAPGATSSQEVIAGVGNGLNDAGVPVERFSAFVRTLHPHVMGRAFHWEPGQEVKVNEASYAFLQTPTFRNSTVAAVYESGLVLRRKLEDPAAPRDYPVLNELASAGFTDYVGVPLRFTSGQVHACSYATRRPGGYTEDQLAAILHVSRPLSRLAEILALRRTAVNFLNTYVGRNAGERIISGKIVRGDTDSIRAVIWFSDLRGFTALAGSVEPVILIGVLNDLFDCQVPAIERHGGEVLKFMGDGLLAIFPMTGQEAGPLCDAALAAAEEAYEALGQWNDKRRGAGDAPIRFGLALHVGDVAYGNIGGANRLDFTCIGPAVNLASRLEGLTGKLELPVLASADFARASSRPMRRVGAFELKGVNGAQEVFAPTDGRGLATW